MIRHIKSPGLKTLAEDIKVLSVLKGIGDYAPSIEKVSSASLQKLYEAMLAMQGQETVTLGALKTMRDKVTAAEWAFHDAIITAKNTVRGQYGNDSNEVQALGMKKSSEFKRPKRKAVVDMKKVA